MIRKLKEEEISHVMTIWTKGNFRANNFIDREYWIENFNKVKEEILLNETYLYIEGEEIKGFITYDNQKNEIIHIAVKETNLRKGIGRKLVNVIKEKKEQINLKVFERNIEGTVFVLAMQFKNIGICVDEALNEKIYNMEWRENDEENNNNSRAN